MPTRIEKAQAYASHLLDGVIQLLEKHAILHPMLANPDVQSVHGSGRRNRGFTTLRASLLLACIQDVAKFAFDRDKRAPSARNLVKLLSDETIREQFRELFAIWQIPLAEDYEDPEIVAALEDIRLAEEGERREQFDALYADLQASWTDFVGLPGAKACRKARNKITAHTEVRYVADKYQPVKLRDLGVTRADLSTTISALQEIVELIGLLVRNASFAWDMLDEQLSRAAQDYWMVPDKR